MSARRRRPRQPAHEARTVPGRRQSKDRPREAGEAKEPGHREMDTITSRRGAHGGDCRLFSVRVLSV